MAEVSEEQDVIAACLEERFHLEGLGRLVASERAAFYLRILEAFDYYRHRHEPEPLNDELYFYVQPFADASYTAVMFQADLQSLKDWGLVSERIEKQRLRGYRDNRRDKYRFTPVPQAMAFLGWLGDGFLHCEEAWSNTQSRLEALLGVLHGLDRLLKASAGGELSEEAAESLTEYLAYAQKLTFEIAEALTRLNIRLTSFTAEYGSEEETTAVLEELRTFLERYIRRLGVQRRDVTELLAGLIEPSCAERLEAACALVADVWKRRRFLLRRVPLNDSPATVLARLTAFYEADGRLDRLCHRIAASVREVWGKLYRKLRDTRYRSRRAEDLELLARTLAEQPEGAVGADVFGALFRPVACLRDAHVWDEDMGSTLPPAPREIGKKARRMRRRVTLPERPESKDVPMTSRRQRLDALAAWMAAHGVGSGPLQPSPLETAEDLHRIFEIHAAGRLQGGRDLRGDPLGMRLEDTGARSVFAVSEAQADRRLETPSVTLALASGSVKENDRD